MMRMFLLGGVCILLFMNGCIGNPWVPYREEPIIAWPRGWGGEEERSNALPPKPKPGEEDYNALIDGYPVQVHTTMKEAGHYWSYASYKTEESTRDAGLPAMLKALETVAKRNCPEGHNTLHSDWGVPHFIYKIDYSCTYSATPPMNELMQGAAQNDPVAQYKLAFQLADSSTRRYWYCRSASQSHEFQDEAFLWLGNLSEHDLHDKVAAYGWYTLAAQHGNTDASTALRKLDYALTTEQTQAAKSKAADWKPGDCGELPVVPS